MRSNRTIQTIVQALTLVIVAAIFYKLDMIGLPGRGGGGAGAIEAPTEAEVKRRYRVWFSERDEESTKAELLSVGVEAVSLEGAVAQVKLNIELRWKGHNSMYTNGPLRSAPGQRGDTVNYTEIFKFRFWGEKKGWDLDDRRAPPVIR